MDKSFIVENAVKTSITAFVLMICWAVLTPTFAAEDAPPGPQDRRAHMEERMTKMDKDLSAEQVRDIVEGRIASMGNANLRVGGVTETPNDTVLVDIVTQDDSLVQTVEISTRTGRPADTERRFDRGNRMGDMGPGGKRRGSRERMGPRGNDFSTLALAMGPKNRELGLTVAQARTLAESRLILAGNERLKVGSVEAIDDKTIVVKIVTVDDSLVVRRNIDRNTGRMQPNRTDN
jgi:hypothetical protein